MIPGIDYNETQICLFLKFLEVFWNICIDIFDGLVQNCSISSGLAMEKLHFLTTELYNMHVAPGPY